MLKRSPTAMDKKKTPGLAGDFLIENGGVFGYGILFGGIAALFKEIFRCGAYLGAEQQPKRYIL